MSPEQSKGPYEDISYDDLLLYAVWTLGQEKKRVEQHDIVVWAFELFPNRFGLLRYEDKYPDSAQVDRSIVRCRDKGYLKGKRGQGYSITNSGLIIVESVSEKLSKSKHPEKSIVQARAHKKSRAGRMISHIKKSTAYKKFRDETKRAEVTEYEVCSMLFCTLDATPDTKRKNLERYRQEAKSGDWADVVEFLNWIESQFSSLFNMEAKSHKGIYG